MNAKLQSTQPSTRNFRLVINGKLTDGASTLDVINPATGRLLTQCARADGAQLDEAVASAKAAFASWSSKPMDERRQLLLKVADALESRSAEFARLLTEEQGKPLGHAVGELAGSVAMIRAFCAMDLPSKVLRETAHERIVQLRVPLGVVAAITPWNYPLILLMIKVAPALLAGNTVHRQTRTYDSAHNFIVWRTFRWNLATRCTERDRRSKRFGWSTNAASGRCQSGFYGIDCDRKKGDGQCRGDA